MFILVILYTPVYPGISCVPMFTLEILYNILGSLYGYYHELLAQ